MFSSRKTTYPLITLSFLTILLWPLFSIPAQAAYNIEIGLPGLPSRSAVSDPGQYISRFFIYGMYLIGFLAVVAIAFGGLTYILSAGSPDKVSKAKSIIGGAIMGIILLFCSWLILNTIDPTLTRLSPQVPPAVNVRGPGSGTGSAPAALPQCQPGFEYVFPGGCVPRAAGIDTAECQRGSRTCTEARCITGAGGCAARNLIWEQSQCNCVQPPAPVTFP